MGKRRFRWLVGLLWLSLMVSSSGWAQEKIEGMETFELSPVADTFVDSGLPFLWFWDRDDSKKDRNFGHSRILSVSRGVKFKPWDRWNRRVVLIQFELSEIPENAEVVRADLSLYHFNGFREKISVHRILRSWSELGATWERPCSGCESWSDGWSVDNFILEPTDTKVVEKSAGWYSWDVTADVRLFTTSTSPNYGWILKSAHTGHNDITSTGFLSREARRKDLCPRLLIQYRFSDPLITFTANPDTITAGESSTLSWQVGHAESVTIEPSVGPVEPSGSITVSPSETTTYQLTAAGPGGSVTQTVTVTVNSPPPSVSLSVLPETIFAGQHATLFWESADAESARIDPEFGEVAPSGSMNVSPTETTTYTVSVSGPGGTANAVATLVVVPGVDEDDDGLPDGWEEEHFGDLNQSWGGDPDGDQLTNLQEFDLGTDPNENNPDTDEDGLPDWWELNYFDGLGQGPDDQADGDGFTNVQEYELETDPTDTDDAPVAGQYYEYDALGRLKGVIVIEPRE